MYLKVEKNNFIRPNWENLGKTQQPLEMVTID